MKFLIDCAGRAATFNYDSIRQVPDAGFVSMLGHKNSLSYPVGQRKLIAYFDGLGSEDDPNPIIWGLAATGFDTSYVLGMDPAGLSIGCNGIDGTIKIAGTEVGIDAHGDPWFTSYIGTYGRVFSGSISIDGDTGELFVNGTHINGGAGSPADVVLDHTRSWAPAYSVSGAANGAYVNLSLQGIVSPPVGYTGFWLHHAPALPSFHIGDAAYTQYAGPVGTVDYLDRIVAGSQVQTTRTLAFSPWGKSYERSTMQLSVINTDGAYDVYAESDPRDVAVNFSYFYPDGVSMLTTLWLIDTVSVKDDSTILINLIEPTAALDGTISTPLFTASMTPDQTLIGTSIALNLGICFDVTPVLVNASSLTYKIGTINANLATDAKDGGYPLNPNSIPVDYTQDSTNGTITLARTPVQQFTVDLGPFNAAASGTASASSTGSGFSAAAVTNGDRIGHSFGSSTSGGWRDNSSGTWGDTCTVLFKNNQILEIDKIVVYTLADDYATRTTDPTDATTFASYGLTSFQIQITNNAGASWSTIETVTGNTHVKHTRSGISASINGIRVVCNGSADGTYARIVELEAWTVAPFYNDSGLWSAFMAYAPSVPTDWAFDSNFGMMSMTDSMGLYLAKPARVIDVAQNLADSVMSCLYWHLANQTLNVFPITEVTAPVSGASQYTKSNMINNTLIIFPDRAENLRTTIKAGRNVNPITQFSTDSSITADVRKTLGSDYRYTATYNGALATMYQFAANNAPLGTMLNSQHDAQILADGLGNLYQGPRMFCKFSEPLDASIDIGSVVSVAYPRYGLDNGLWMLVSEVTYDFVAYEMILTCNYAQPGVA